VSEKDLSLAQSVRLAADTELKSVDFYRNAAQKASRESLKRLFNGLADFEQLHHDQVIALALSLQKEGKFLFYEGCSLSIPAQSAIEVSPEAREALEATRLSLMAVITAAQNVEVHAAKSYAELANQVSDPDGQAMFRQLAKEEQQHLRLLTDVYWNLNDHGVIEWPSL
jgi:rubrerythrin